MRTCHTFAITGLQITRFLAAEWRRDDVIPEGEDAKDDERMAVEPRSDSINLFVPRSGEQWRLSGGRDVLFSPFLFQGLPLISSGEELEMDGFAKLGM